MYLRIPTRYYYYYYNMFDVYTRWLVNLVRSPLPPYRRPAAAAATADSRRRRHTRTHTHTQHTRTLAKNRAARPRPPTIAFNYSHKLRRRRRRRHRAPTARPGHRQSSSERRPPTSVLLFRTLPAPPFYVIARDRNGYFFMIIFFPHIYTFPFSSPGKRYGF